MKEISKTRRVIGYILVALPTLMLAVSGTAKIMEAEPLVESLSKINLQEDIVTIGLIEILCAIIYWLPKAGNIGFFLVCSYYGGVIASEWAMGHFPLFGVVLLTLFYVGSMLKKPTLSGLNI